MTELDLLREFFKAWKELHAMPNARGAPSQEKKMAAQRLVDCAHAVETFSPDPVTSFCPPEVEEFRRIQTQIGQIEPKNGWKPNGA